MDENKTKNYREKRKERKLAEKSGLAHNLFH